MIVFDLLTLIVLEDIYVLFIEIFILINQLINLTICNWFKDVKVIIIFIFYLLNIIITFLSVI